MICFVSTLSNTHGNKQLGVYPSYYVFLHGQLYLAKTLIHTINRVGSQDRSHWKRHIFYFFF